MNKTILKTVSTFLFLTVVSGCNNSDVSSSSNNTSSFLTLSSTTSKISSTQNTSSITKSASLEEMLEKVSNPNITYRSDYSIYYYYIDNAFEVFTMQRYDVVAKITEELYDMKAYVYGENSIASYAHLERDEEGYVSFSDININNELVTERAVDGSGNPFLWEESVYYNLVKYLNAADFEKIDESTYKYIGDLDGLPVNIIHTAVPLSAFNLESFTIKTKDNAIESLNFQEVESDEVYADCMYGRTITLRFENIGTTEAKRIEPYVEDAENDELGIALYNIRSKDNYTITSKGILEDGNELLFQETYITEDDILQVQNTDSGLYKTGCHTYNDELYIFESTGEYLLGQKATSGTTVSNFVPTFNFSKDVFEFIEENDEGYRVYRPYSTMSAVLDYVDVISQYSEAYYSPAGDIYFFVKDNKLSKIEFPVYIYSSSTPLVATNRLTFSNFDSTNIESSTWDSFVLELPNSTASSWTDDAYRFSLEISNTEKVEITLGEVFEKCLGSSTAIPYFIPEWENFAASGNYSKSDDAVYLSLTSTNGVNPETVSYIKNILLEDGYENDSYEDEMMKVEIFFKGDIEIEIIMIPEEEMIEISFSLPVGDLLN